MNRGGALVLLFLAAATAAAGCGNQASAHPRALAAPHKEAAPRDGAAPGVRAGAGARTRGTSAQSPRAAAGSWGSPSARAYHLRRSGLWSGAGRHPQWRGCQHTYDPAMTAFISGRSTTIAVNSATPRA